MSEKQEKILGILAQVLDKPRAELKPEQHLKSDLALDSAQALDLLATIEDELDIEIDELEASRLETVGDVLAFADRVG